MVDKSEGLVGDWVARVRQAHRALILGYAMVGADLRRAAAGVTTPYVDRSGIASRDRKDLMRLSEWLEGRIRSGVSIDQAADEAIAHGWIDELRDLRDLPGGA